MFQKISIYGATGFIGSNLMRMYGSRACAVPRDASYLDCDSIIYLISTNNNYNVFSDPHIDIDTNLNKMVSILEATRQSGFNGVFNFVSSWFVYGSQPYLPVSESAKCNPKGFYSITKYAAEMLLQSYCDTFGIDYRIMRLCNIVGKGDRCSSKKNALQNMFYMMKNGDKVSVYDNGLPIRDIMHVDDACRAIDICINNGRVKEIYNISNSDPASIGDIIRYAHADLGSSSEISFIEAPKFHSQVQAKDMWLDNRKLISIGYVPSKKWKDACSEILEEIKNA